jgi:ribosomal protein S18 acetylase RimI-like enzyme
LKFKIEKVTADKERERVKQFVQIFWGEQEQQTFDKRFIVANLPSYVAKIRKKIIGFISFAEENNAVIIVALGVLPEAQSGGVGEKLAEKVEAEAKTMGKSKLLVSTSNDDLPALAFYQSIGFQIYEVKPNIIAEKHGETLKGIAGLPVRDELRLRKIIKE